jgi:L-ribulose-5-phosphate 4-epimerase
MQNHGPFTIGASAKDAVKAAVMVEDVARTVHLAREAGPLLPLPQEAIDRLYDRYQNVYGQAGDTRRVAMGSTGTDGASTADEVSTGSTGADVSTDSTKTAGAR